MDSDNEEEWISEDLARCILRDIDFDLHEETSEDHPFDTDDEEDEEQVYFNKSGEVEWKSVFQRSESVDSFPKFDESIKGFSLDPTSIKTPKDAFLHFMDVDALDLIVKFTNAEAAAAGDHQFKEFSRLNLLAWIGILINAGVMGCNFTNIDALWTSDTVNGNGFYRAIMSKHRFQQISKHIRFDDSVARRTPRQVGEQAKSYQRSKDRLELVRPVIERVRSNFVNKYLPGKNLTVDERIVSYRGRCVFKVYMKGKPSPYGIKIWGMSDPENAYFVNFDVYAGMVVLS